LKLRGQIDQIEAKSTKMVQEEKNAKKLYNELARLLNHIKISDQSERVLNDPPFLDDSKLGTILTSMKQLKESLEVQHSTDGEGLRFLEEQN